MRTITGAEFRNFYQNNFPEGAWHEDLDESYSDLIEDEVGNYILSDEAILEMSKLGYVVSGGDGEQLWRSFEEVYDEVMSPRQESVIAFVIPNERKEEILAAMAAMGVEPVDRALLKKPEAGSDLQP